MHSSTSRELSSAIHKKPEGARRDPAMRCLTAYVCHLVTFHELMSSVCRYTTALYTHKHTHTSDVSCYDQINRLWPIWLSYETIFFIKQHLNVHKRHAVGYFWSHLHLVSCSEVNICLVLSFDDSWWRIAACLSSLLM